MADNRLWELLAKQFDGLITEDELRELQALLNGQQDVMPGELFSELRELPLHPAPEERITKGNSLASIMQSIRETPVHSYKKSNLYGWTAVAAVFLVLGATWFLRREIHSQTANTYDRIVTKAGSRTLINLPDSSTVVLNSACQFAYNKDFGVRRREMHLTGEAYFDIHSNPDMPLVVHAGNAIIRVLGTSFNVRANAEDSFVEATLVKGIIEVSLKTDPDRKILLRPGEKIIIRDHAGQTPRDSSRSQPHEEVIRVTRVEMDAKDSSYIETAWMKEKLSFKKETFSLLARRMERWYQVQIIFADTSLQSLLFTGSFEKETVSEALAALRRTTPFSYSINGRTITLSHDTHDSP
jgi:ferric-dicitrate binding protein FerR (iron transport regulator)